MPPPYAPLVFGRVPLDSPYAITTQYGDPSATVPPHPHRGTDLIRPVPVHWPIYAPADGTVVSFTNDGSFGTGVCLDHEGTEWYSLYAHLSGTLVSVGDKVREGQQIGWTGVTGLTTGEHLHWQVCKSSTFPLAEDQNADPMSFLHSNITDVPVLNAVDMSRWGGELTAEEAECMVAKGIKLLIVGDGSPQGAGTWARQQAQAWVDAGGEHLWAYIYLYFGDSAETQIDAAFETLKGLPVEEWSLDAEDVSAFANALSQQDTIKYLWKCIRHVESKGSDPVIYSGGWWWNPHVGGTTEFGKYRLWDSAYPDAANVNNAVILPWAGRVYGGFSTPYIFQYKGTVDLCGQSVDLNWVPDLGGGVMGISQADFDALKAKLEAFERAVFAGAERPATEDDAARTTYAEYRISQKSQSVNDKSESASVTAAEAKGLITPGMSLADVNKAVDEEVASQLAKGLRVVG